MLRHVSHQNAIFVVAKKAEVHNGLFQLTSFDIRHRGEVSAGCWTPEGCSSSFSAISPPPPELSDLEEVSPVLFPIGSTSETPRLSHPPWLAIAKPAPHARCQLLFILLLFSRWRHSEAAPGCCWELLRHRSVSCAMSTCSGSDYLCSACSLLIEITAKSTFCLISFILQEKDALFSSIHLFLLHHQPSFWSFEKYFFFSLHSSFTVICR